MAEERRAKGKTEFTKHNKGMRLTPLQSIKAKCYECMGHYVDVKEDCRIPDCPLYPYMPYKGVFSVD